MYVAAILMSEESSVKCVRVILGQPRFSYEPGLYILTKVSGKPDTSGSSPPTTTAFAPSLCASRTFLINSHCPRCTKAIHASVGSFGPLTQSLGHPGLGAGDVKELLDGHGTVNEERGMTYPKIGSLISAPKAADAAGQSA